MPTATTRARIMPCCPPSACPTALFMAVGQAIRMAVFIKLNMVDLVGACAVGEQPWRSTGPAVADDRVRQPMS